MKTKKVSGSHWDSAVDTFADVTFEGDNKKRKDVPRYVQVVSTGEESTASVTETPSSNQPSGSVKSIASEDKLPEAALNGEEGNASEVKSSEDVCQS